jgi:hypothetical protein
VEIVRNELDEEEALELESETMLKHGDCLLNLNRPAGGLSFAVSIDERQLNVESVAITNEVKTDLEENTRYWALRESNKAFVAATKPFEATDLETAAKRYREALLKLREYGKIGRRLSRSTGLRGEYEEIGKRSDVAILNRLTLCLTKLNRGSEAVREADQHFADFPDDRESSIGQAIIRRIERIKAQTA